jgi:3-oxoacyl-ACP reductase-like protein
MTFGLGEVMTGIGAFLTIYIINNARLKEGITDWILGIFGRNTYDITEHNVREQLKALKFDSRLNEFDNKIKTDLYHYYVETVLNTMHDLVTDILDNHKKMNFSAIKAHVKNNMYDRLSSINIEIDKQVSMPDQLQEKFDKFRNYLTKQHTYSIDNALHASNKKLLLVQVLDAIENNSRWFLFYTTEMFENFNGHFDALSRNEVFIKQN